MFIKNVNLKKRLGMCRLLQADGGAGTGGPGESVEGEPGDEGNKGEDEGTKGDKGNEPSKTFTQEELDAIVKDRIARVKKGQPSKEELKAYNDWKESQKTESERQQEALNNAEKAKLEAEERAILAETKVNCLSKGVDPKSVDDVVTLAKAMVTDDLDIDKAIDKVLEKYPSFKGEQQLGFKIGGKGTGDSKATDDDLKRAFGL